MQDARMIPEEMIAMWHRYGIRPQDTCADCVFITKTLRCKMMGSTIYLTPSWDACGLFQKKGK